MLFAHDVLKDALRCFPDHALITQRYCLSLIKGGFLQAARTLLTSMVKRGHLDEETLGILGRVHKEMWLIEGGGSADHPHLAKARELYLGAFARSRGAWSGINAASLSMIMGDRARASRLAREVIRICAERWREPGSATTGPSPRPRRRTSCSAGRQQAATYYAYARRRNDGSYSSLASTRRQLRCSPGTFPSTRRSWTTCAFPRWPPSRATCIDAPGQETRAIPREAADAVQAAHRGRCSSASTSASGTPRRPAGRTSSSTNACGSVAARATWCSRSTAPIS